MLSPPYSPPMSRIYAEPQDSTWHLPVLVALPFRPSHSLIRAPSGEQDFTTSPRTTFPPSASLLSVKPEQSSGQNPVSSGDFFQADSSVEIVQRVAVVNALGLNLDDRVEENTEENMIRPFPLHMEFASAKEALGLDEAMRMTTPDLEDHLLEEDILKTAGEDRVDKRRMKRFRLTHGQTRFLQSEFARQAHPDSAQRERLSREIPGLSPRQVQVWFQNRRAKMKRLMGDDRERMIKSRAMPEGFDTTRYLRSPYLRSPPAAVVTMKAEEDDLHLVEMTCPHDEKLTGSPSTVSSNLDSSYAAASSVAASEAMSPVSSPYDTPHLSDSLRSSRANSYPIIRYSRSLSFPQVYDYFSRPPSNADAEHEARRRAESLANPMGHEFAFGEVGWDQSSSNTSGIDQPSLASSNHHPDKALQNPFGVPADLSFVAAQNIFAPEAGLKPSSNGLWIDCGISTSTPSSERDMPTLCPDFAISSQSLCVPGNFNGLPAVGSEVMQGPSSLFLAAEDGTSAISMFYQQIHAVAESYPAGF